MVTRRVFSVVALLAVIACGGRSSSSDPSVKPVRMAAPDSVLTCADWVNRAIADPEIGVERVPEPVAMTPAAVPRRIVNAAYGKDGKAELRLRVLVDTLGVADMKTFTMVASSHETLTNAAKAAVAKWKFVPAQIAGCKVPRNYNWGVTITKPKTRPAPR